METKGLIHLYTGGGKGKTTAAVGLCVRALGAGLRVRFVQFMKGRGSAELAPLRQLGAHVTRATNEEKFVFQMNEQERAACQKAHRACLAEAAKTAAEWDLLVLDEALGALETGLLAEEELLPFMREKPPGLELVLTGRSAPETLRALADYVTDMRAEKHPFAAGIPARRGIEF